jgi:hypothetical protein
LLKSS